MKLEPLLFYSYKSWSRSREFEPLLDGSLFFILLRGEASRRLLMTEYEAKPRSLARTTFLAVTAGSEARLSLRVTPKTEALRGARSAPEDVDASCAHSQVQIQGCWDRLQSDSFYTYGPDSPQPCGGGYSRAHF